ncbi:hypothetical protein C8R42DRAFT_379013 [Lentinula raphanica]|nr:hypothetical protein C8R42DRAFT_379013 [Lentinula raphanica]
MEIHLSNCSPTMSLLPGLRSNRNKPRICVALYFRGEHHRHPDSTTDSYHSAILLVPKSLKTAVTAWRFHATNSIRTHLEPGGQSIFITDMVWRYEPSQTTMRTTRLLALVFLGKLPSEVSPHDLNVIFRDNVPVVQNDPTWTCNSWTRSAIEVMKNHGIINAPIQPEMIMANGEYFADNFELDRNLPVPTCDIYGQSIDSLLSLVV